MADTPRTLPELQTLLADNSTGLISAQHIRDFLVSALGGCGSIHVLAGVTAQVVSGTPILMTGWTTNGIASSTTPDFATGKITIGVAGDYDVELDFGSFIGSNGSTPTVEIYQNGAGTGAKANRTLGTPAAPGSCGTAIQLTCAANDTIEVWVSSTSTSFTPQEAVLKVTRIS